MGTSGSEIETVSAVSDNDLFIVLVPSVKVTFPLIVAINVSIPSLKPSSSNVILKSTVLELIVIVLGTGSPICNAAG